MPHKPELDSITPTSPVLVLQSDSETLLGIGGPWRGS
jgi:hypothetical protein